MQNFNRTCTMLVSALALATLVGGLSACQAPGAAEPGVVTAATDKTRASTRTIAPVSTASKALPDGFPDAAVVIYKPSTLTYASKLGSGRLSRWMVVADTPHGVDKVARSVAQDYRALGAKVIQTPMNQAGVGQVVTARDGYGIAITYSGKDDGSAGTSISYIVHQQRVRR